MQGAKIITLFNSDYLAVQNRKRVKGKKGGKGSKEDKLKTEKPRGCMEKKLLAHHSN